MLGQNHSDEFDNCVHRFRDALIPGHASPAGVPWMRLNQLALEPHKHGVSKSDLVDAIATAITDASSFAPVLSPSALKQAQEYLSLWMQIVHGIGSKPGLGHARPAHAGLLCVHWLSQDQAKRNLNATFDRDNARIILQGLADDALVEDIDATWGAGAARRVAVAMVKALRQDKASGTLELTAETPVMGTA